MGLEERPTVLIGTEYYRSSRPEIVGQEVPQPPFPIFMSGAVQRGFGRGGKDLGCPTANLPDESIIPMSSVTKTGVYYGYAQVSRERDGKTILLEEDGRVLPMVMSLGWNPFYKNERMSAEIHVIHNFRSDFYGHDMKVMVLGYIRPELDYISREALIEDIETDKHVALKSIAREGYQQFESDSFFSTPNQHRL
ncbi:riboflavin kinase [Ganoderma leucocontextum]|nr:riboflavin kinase [Ganoderma leucocontextum]